MSKKISMKKGIVNALKLCSVALLFSMAITGCKKTEIAISTTTDVNIVGYLDKHLDSFSLFRQILERTETSAYLNAYGAYTCFAVTNAGVQSYLTSLGVTTVDAADLPTLKDMVKLHLLEDTVTTSSFTDGKLPVITMYGQYLITGVTSKYGVSSYLINRQGFVLQSNIKTGNGLIHIIDNVLTPAKLSLAKLLESKPEYSIFTQAVKETGYYNLLNTVNNPDPVKRFLTLIAESNKALEDSGINSYTALKAKYAQNANLTSDTNKLNMYVAYHILLGINFLGDIIVAPSHLTLAPQEVISTELINQQVLINQVEFNGVLEPGVQLRRNTSDVAATNGVLHDAGAHFAVKFRKPTAVYWDVSDFPEIRKLPAFYKKQNKDFIKFTEAELPIRDINWQFTNSGQYLQYLYGSASTITNFACNQDVNAMPLGSTNRPKYIDYRTPVLIKGKYKVWICYRGARQSTSTVVVSNVIIDGETMQRPFNFTTDRPGGTDDDLLNINYKRYTENTSGSFVGRMVGIVDIKTTERHMLRIDVQSGTQNNNYLDMVHFIPVDENQVLPRFRNDGTKVFQ